MRTSDPASGNKLDAVCLQNGGCSGELRAGRRTNQTPIPGIENIFPSLFHSVVTGPVFYPALQSMDTVDSFPEVKRLGHEAEHSCPYVRYVQLTKVKHIHKRQTNLLVREDVA
jgi:hypothetical protein